MGALNVIFPIMIVVVETAASPIQIVSTTSTSKDSLTGPDKMIALTLPDVVDLRDIQFRLEPKFESYTTSNASSNPFFQILVHSKPGHFEARSLIRKTWGSVKEIEGHIVRVAFLIGSQSSAEGKFFSDQKLNSAESIPIKVFRDLRSISSLKRKSNLAGRLTEEAYTYGDILQGSFLDTPQNDSIKHMLGLKWAQEQIASGIKPDFILKTEDHVFIEIFHLVNFVQAVYSSKKAHERSLICDVIPRGTGPRENNMISLVPLPGHQDPVELYPDYCSGSGFLLSPDLVSEILETSTKVPKFWNGDIYVTGLIRQALRISPKYLNLRYSNDEQSYMKWLESKSTLPLPYIFVTLNASNPDGMVDVFKRLWTKTISIQNQ
ncbi:UDP-GalNAc:beta-1,3-N-acetylgalactosaminyltransferase 1-like [Tigriopus californicus]|nr:UDP-GalNAc:beta-1,3-N-acetylgalactosaminyltransferase 1-like [Tigriopus californicus]